MVTINEQKPDPSSLLVLVIISVACLVPFIDKAFHIDDPMFLWAARQIQSSPLDFYGFTVNWYGIAMPMSEVMKNPPLVSYYIALVAHLFGWGEMTLHAAFIIPAAAAVIGSYYLAAEFCATPLIAALVGVLTPVFLLSSTTVMCDVMMLALWVWATVLWIRGLKINSVPHLIFAALLIALCSLTKYFGMSLIPLLLVYSAVKKRTLGPWVLFLLIPVVVLAAYQWLTYAWYGRGLLMDASSYVFSTQQHAEGDYVMGGLSGLLFTGGCFISVLFYSVLLWRRRTIVIGASLAMLFIVLVFSLLPIRLSNGFQYNSESNFSWLFAVQYYLFALAGISILVLAASDLWTRKDADSLLLFLWIMGTFLFAGFLNWSVNARSVLPMAPAVGILVLRRAEQRKVLNGPILAKYALLLLLPSLVVALSVTWADYKWANTSRSMAVEISQRYKNYPGTIWFQGHWGFQYYMEAAGGKAIDAEKSNIAAGDIVIIPGSNANSEPLPTDLFHLVYSYKIAPFNWLSTMNVFAGSGFYSSKWGPLPFALGSVPDVQYSVLVATGKKPVQ